MMNTSQLDLLANLLYISNSLLKECELNDSSINCKDKNVDEIKDMLSHEFVNDAGKENAYKDFITNLNYKFNECLLTRNIKNASQVIGERFLLYPEVKEEILSLLEDGLNKESLKNFESILMSKSLNDKYVDMFFQGILEQMLFWGIMNSKK